jgi:hypothetical protein
MRNATLVSFVTFVSFLSFAPKAGAQTSEAVGVRAQGMAGAFTAVADDATATWWNPAGLAGGAYGNAILEYGTEHQPKDERDSNNLAVPSQRLDTRGFAAAFPALGISYYHLRVSEIQPVTSTATPTGGRQDPGTVVVREQSIALSQFGATIGQSIGQHFVIGSTVKVVQGSRAAADAPASSASLDQASELDGPTETHVGFDLGAMASFGKVRVGLTVRNVTEMDFGVGDTEVTLKRQARVGAAYSTGRRGVIGTATLAVDGDLTTTTTVLGDERRLAVGGEIWVASQRVGLRGGVNTNTVGARQTALSGGLSGMLLKHTFVDAQATGGTDTGRRGWAFDLRVTF